MSASGVQKGDSLTGELRNAALAQTGDALGGFRTGAQDREAAIHRARRACKRLRALVRLIGANLTGGRDHDIAIRVAAKQLSFARDADVLVATFEKLMASQKRKIGRRAAATIRAELASRRDHALAHHDIEARIADFIKDMTAIERRVRAWRVKGKGFDAIDGGLAKTYRQARKGMAAARAAGRARDFHDWRKHVKYHAMQTDLMRDLWPGAAKAQTRRANRLGDILGEHHDLAVLSHLLSERPGEFGGANAIAPVLTAATRRQNELEDKAFKLGERLLGEKPADMARRWRAHWKKRRGGKAATPALAA